MRILINGVYFGGNSPIFYKVLKDMGHEVKICDILFIDSYKERSSLFALEDIIIPSYSKFKVILLKFYRKFYRKLWKKELISFAHEVINDFQPEIIFNHQVSVRSNIMLDTNFKPQFNFVYGSEIKGRNIGSVLLEQAIRCANLTFVPSIEAKNILLNSYDNISNKLCLNTTNFIYVDYELKKYLSVNINELREKNKYSSDDFIIYDNRSLRDKELSLLIIESVKFLKTKSIECKVILVKGYSGNDNVIKFVKSKIVEWDLNSHIKIIEKSITDDFHYQLLSISNVYCSILKADEFGSGIAQAMYYKKTLLLSNLEVYRKHIKNNASYINSYNVKEFSNAIINLMENKVSIDFNHNFTLVDEKFNAVKNIEFILNKIS